jgi:hypothetical protein
MESRRPSIAKFSLHDGCHAPTFPDVGIEPPCRLLALFGPDAPASDCLFAEVKQTSLSRWQSSDASLRATKVTLAPTDDGVLRMNRYPPIGASDEAVEATKVRQHGAAARVFGVHTKAAITATKARGTKLDGNRGVKPTVKMRTKSAAAHQQRASARAADITPPIAELQGGWHYVIKTDRSRAQRQGYLDCAGEGALTAPRVKRALKRLVR